MESTLYRVLQRAASLNLEGAGFRYLDRREQAVFRSFPDLACRAGRLAAGLVKQGVTSGDTVAIVLPTTPEFTDIFFACCHIGAIPVPLYPPVRLGRLDEYFERTATMLSQVEAKIMVTDARVGKLMGSVVARYRPPAGMHRVDSLLEDVACTPQPPNPDDVAMVQFSSGTTGAPKPVVLTHRQVLSNANAILDIEPDDDDFSPSAVSWLPLYHDMGLIGCVIPALMYPAELTLIPPEAFLAKPALWLRAISRYRGLISPAPNFAYALAVERIQDDQLEGVDLSCWRFALNGAEPTSADTMRAFIDRFAAWGLRPEALTPVYGLSEAALAVTFGEADAPFLSRHFDAQELSGGRAVIVESGAEISSVGRPLRGFEIQIRDGSGSVLSDGHIGRLWASGPSVMDRYLDGSPPPRDGDWLDTGDLGFVLEEELYITGRAKDVIIIRGRNHNPHTLEVPLDTVDGVRTGCSAVVSEIQGGGERIFVFVETRGEVADDLAERCRVAVRAATGVDPDVVIPLAAGTLPRTSSGKIRRCETMARWQAGTLVAPKAVTPLRMAGALARSAWSEWNARHSPSD
jgi:fatty-acyl-CoA synthase